MKPVEQVSVYEKDQLIYELVNMLFLDPETDSYDPEREREVMGSDVLDVIVPMLKEMGVAPTKAGEEVEPVAVKQWLLDGEMDDEDHFFSEVIESLSRKMDKACVADITGTNFFEGTDGKIYTVAVQGTIIEAQESYFIDQIDNESADLRIFYEAEKAGRIAIDGVVCPCSVVEMFGCKNLVARRSKADGYMLSEKLLAEASVVGRSVWKVKVDDRTTHRLEIPEDES